MAPTRSRTTPERSSSAVVIPFPTTRRSGLTSTTAFRSGDDVLSAMFYLFLLPSLMLATLYGIHLLPRSRD
jgi:hypothetical protein